MEAQTYREITALASSLVMEWCKAVAAQQDEDMRIMEMLAACLSNSASEKGSGEEWL